jgi:hypothetical protein
MSLGGGGPLGNDDSRVRVEKLAAEAQATRAQAVSPSMLGPVALAAEGRERLSLIFILIGLVVLYFVIRTAVRDGIRDAQKPRERR